MKRTHSILPLVSIAASLLITCSINPVTDGNSSQTGNAVAFGTIYRDDGGRAADAVVRFVPLDQAGVSAPLSKRDAVSYEFITGGDGVYRVDTMPDGLYSLLASGQGNRAFRDSVKIDNSKHTDIGFDTLREPGSLKGVTALLPGQDPRSVMILVFGASVITSPDDSVGNFLISSLARGTYRLRFLTTTAGYAPFDTTVVISAGAETVLADTIRLRFTGLLPPASISARWDTLTTGQGFAVRSLVSWTPVSDLDLSTYVVFRCNPGSSVLEQVSQRIITDTAYADTFFTDGADTGLYRYEYRIKTRDADYNMSQAYSPAAFVDIPAAGRYKPWVSMRRLDSENPVLNDTSVFELKYAGFYRNNALVSWFIGGPGSMPSREISINQLRGIDTFRTVFTTSGVHTVTARVIDVAGVSNFAITITDTSSVQLAPPGLVSAEWDTSCDRSILSWTPVTSSGLYSYVVFRADSGALNLQQINTGAVTDTTYRDTISSGLTTTPHVFEYRLKTQDANLNFSADYSEPVFVRAVSYAAYRTTVNFYLSGYISQFPGENRMVPGDSGTVQVQYINAMRNNIRITWFIDDTAAAVRTLDISQKSGADAIPVSWSTAGSHVIYCRVTDESGAQYWKSVAITVLPVSTALQYVRDSLTCTIGTAIARDSLLNVAAPAESIVVQPALPPGLSLNTATGTISGTPTMAASPAYYTVFVYSIWSTRWKDSAQILISVQGVAPSPAYALNPLTCTHNIAITPDTLLNLAGTPDSMSISPALPAGLALNRMNGVISGTPTVTSALQAYTVQVHYPANTVSTTLDIEIR